MSVDRSTYGVAASIGLRETGFRVITPKQILIECVGPVAIGIATLMLFSAYALVIKQLGLPFVLMWMSLPLVPATFVAFYRHTNAAEFPYARSLRFANGPLSFLFFVVTASFAVVGVAGQSILFGTVFTVLSVTLVRRQIRASRRRRLVEAVASSVYPSETVLADDLCHLPRRHGKGSAVVAVTDRRLIVADLRSGIPRIRSFAFCDVSRLDFGWRAAGIVGRMEITFSNSYTMRFDQMTPLNLLALVSALEDNGVLCHGPASAPSAREQLDDWLTRASNWTPAFSRVHARTRRFRIALALFPASIIAVYVLHAIVFEPHLEKVGNEISMIVFDILCVACGAISRSYLSVLFVPIVWLTWTPLLLMHDIGRPLLQLSLLTIGTAAFLIVGAQWTRGAESCAPKTA